MRVKRRSGKKEKQFPKFRRYFLNAILPRNFLPYDGIIEYKILNNL